jgi:TonB-linked SusC/RagA family outer membrane protein
MENGSKAPNKWKQWKAIALLLFCFAFLTTTAYSQSVVRGMVTAPNGSPAPGVTVQQKGAKTQAVSDSVGRFTITVTDPAQAVLVFSSVGFETKEISVGGRSTVNVALEIVTKMLDEVVAVGYGTVKKRDVTGAVASIKGEELMKTNPTSINQALQGKMAGVIVSQADGAPGAGINIQIRGANSFSTSTEPLYVIDGVPFNVGEAPGTDFATKQTNNPLNLINPRDVLSIEVLKDASATAIYGSRGANGVVLITTKGGSKNRTRVEFSSTSTVSRAIRQIKVLDAATYAEYRNEMIRNRYLYDGGEFVADTALPFPIPGRWAYSRVIDPVTGLETIIDSTYNPSPQDYRDGYMNNGTDWQDQIFQTALTQDYNLSISGGDDKGTYLLAIGALDQQGIIRNSYFKRYNIRSNVDRRINNWFSIGNYLTASKSDNRMARTNSETFGIIPSALAFTPTRTVFDPDEPSGVSEDFSNGLSNPYLYVRSAKNILGAMNLYNSSFAKVKLTDFLTFKQDLGYAYSYNQRDIYYNRFISGGIAPVNGYGMQSDNYYQSVLLQSTLSFNKQLSKNHRIDGVAGYTFENVTWGGKTMSGSNFPNDITENNDMSAALLQNVNSSSKGKSSLMSFLGRVNYSLFDRYLITANYRRDGSSRLSKQGRWADFYSVALAWKLTEEDFIKNLDFFDEFKIRGGYGETGNQGVSAYATRSRMTAQNYPYNGTLQSGYAEDRWGGPAAPNLKWETTRQFNIGLDIGFLNNRVNFVIDYYHKKTSDLLQYAFIPLSTGFASIATNYGNVENKGLEIAGSFGIIQRPGLTWKVDANISFNRNKISGLDADQFSDVVWGLESMFLRRNGHSIGTIYGYQENGFYDNEAEVRADPAYTNESDAKIKSMVGQVKYRDNNKDGIIDDRDKAIIGNTNPDFVYGMTNTITYKKWSFSFFLQGINGNDILNTNLRSFDMASTTNIPQFVWDNRWTANNKQRAEFPRGDITFTRSLRASDRLIENGSYLRLRNVSVGYRWDRPIPQISSLNFTLSANNLITFTDYRWYDPDVNAFGSDPARRGVDMASYPSAQTFTFGLQVAF